MRAIDATRKPPVTIEVDATLVQAAELMDKAAVGALVVVDGGRPVGIVTDRDIVVRAVARRLEFDGRVDGVMTPGVVSLDADADLHAAVPVFARHAIRRLPLLDHDRMVGMLTLDDLLMDLSSDLANVTRPITGEVLFGHPEASVPATAS